MDYGERYTLKTQAELERRMRRIYRQAQEELVAKLNEHNTQMSERAKVWQAQLESGKITPAKFNRLMNEEIFKSKQWKAKIQSVTSTLLDANRQANAIVEDKKRAVYGENALYQAYSFEKGYSGFSFDIYDSATVTRMIREEPELLPRKTVNGRKDEAWNRHNIADAITQGIIQGESIPQIANRIAKQTASTNEKAMVRYARTAMTSAQNAGRIEAMHEAQEMGIKVKKRWLATLDSRTRDSHAHLDGETVDVDDKFSNGLEYPGDPHGEPGEVFNCRCTLEYVYPEYEGLSENAQRREYIEWTDKDGNEHRKSKVIDDISFSEWRKNHPLPPKKEKQPKTAKTQTSTPAQPMAQPKTTAPQLAGVSIGNPMAHAEADSGKVNPNFRTNRAYEINCQSCVVAYEARLRGYDVEVVPNDKAHPMCQLLSRNTKRAWIDPATGQEPNWMYPARWTYPSLWQGDKPTPKRFKEMLMRDIEEDKRYHIGFGWKGTKNSGHIITMGKKNGEIYFYDPQCNREYTGASVDAYINRMKMEMTLGGQNFYRYPEVLRVDDKDINFGVANGVVRGKP